MPSKKPAFSLCVYCGSRHGNNPVFTQVAREVGHWIGTHGGQLVYGGGRNGLMGEVAQATLEAGGTVVGIIPKALQEREWAHDGCTELHIVPGMHERKRLFTDLADGFLTLPGGVGTMDELWEAISWAQLGYHSKPVGLLNAAGFYNGLLEFNAHMISVGFIRPQHKDILIADDDLDRLLARMADHVPHQTILAMKVDDL